MEISRIAMAKRRLLEIEVPEDPAPLLDELRAVPIVRDSTQRGDSSDDLRQADHHHGRRRTSGAGRARRHCRGRPAQHPRRADLGRHDPAGRANSLSPAPCAPSLRLPRVAAARARGIADGRRDRTGGREVRRRACSSSRLNMAGSVPDAADLVVTDPVQAGVMAVMAIAETAKFSVGRLQRRVF